MSKQYREEMGVEMDVITSPEMRKFCQRPGKMDIDGNPIYTTEQSHKSECDVNEIIKKYDRTGLITHIQKIEAQFGDLTGADFKAMQDQIILAKNMFANLPVEIRNRFDNEPGKLLEFMENPENREEAIELGLIDERTPEEVDGLGEHVVDGKKIVDGKTIETEAEPLPSENK